MKNLTAEILERSPKQGAARQPHNTYGVNPVLKEDWVQWHSNFECHWPRGTGGTSASQKEYSQIVSLFPEKIQEPLLSLSDSIKSRVNEFRLRVGKPIILNLDTESIVINGEAEVLRVTKKDLVDTFSKMCQYSVYSYQNEIKNGFITLPGGHRVGICGTAVLNNGDITNIKDISSMNIRVARENSDFNVDICSLIDLNFTGILIVGPPGSGKTTLLKSLAKNYSTREKKVLTQVCVVDERGELSGTYLGEEQFNLGYADVLNGYQKPDGISHALRAMGPDIIICDEILEYDAHAIKCSVNSGVRFIASTHAGSPEELLRKAYINELIQVKAFDKFIFLSDKNNPSTIKKILSAKELFTVEPLSC